MRDTNSEPYDTAHVIEERGFDLLDIALILAKGWKWILGFSVSLGLLVFLTTFAMKPRFSATVTFLIDQDSNSGSIVLFRQNDPTISLLESRAITEFVLRHIDSASFAKDHNINLANPYGGIALENSVRGEVEAKKSDQGVYSVTVQDRKPVRAVAVANAYLDALQDLSNRMSFESAAQTRVFYEQQLAIERAALEKAQAAVIQSQAKTGLLQPSSQASMEVGQINSYRSQVVALEVQRANISQSATAENPEMIRLNAQISELNGKISALQARINTTANEGLPSQTQETTSLQREVTFHEAQLTAMGTLLERARMQESFSIPKVHVVDRAILPVPRTFPKRFLMTAISAVAGAFFGLVIVIVLNIFRRLDRNPESAQKIAAIRQAFRRQRA